jgi:hypothetical protein
MRIQALASSASPLDSGSPKKDQHGVTDKFIDRAAMFERDVGHLGKILVEQSGNLFGLQAFRCRGKILDVGKKDRKFLALGVDRYVLLTAENALVDLRRQIARNLHRQCRQKFIRGLEFAIDAANRRRLASLTVMKVKPVAAMKTK